MKKLKSINLFTGLAFFSYTFQQINKRKMAKGYKWLQSMAKVLGGFIFSLPGCVGERPPHPKTMLSFINLTLRPYFNIVWGERGVFKIKYELLKSKDSVISGALFHSASQVLLPLIVVIVQN